MILLQRTDMLNFVKFFLMFRTLHVQTEDYFWKVGAHEDRLALDLPESCLRQPQAPGNRVEKVTKVVCISVCVCSCPKEPQISMPFLDQPQKDYILMNISVWSDH